MNKYSVLLLLLLQGKIFATTLIENRPIEIGQLVPKSGQCWLRSDSVSAGIIEHSSPKICMENNGQVGHFILLTAPSQLVTFRVTVPAPVDPSLIGKLDFRIEGEASNDLGDKKSVRPDEDITIDSGSSGRVTIIMGGLLEINQELPYGAEHTLTYTITY
jgi:hypothetical protein